jgi:hypothetical protein
MDPRIAERLAQLEAPKPQGRMWRTNHLECAVQARKIYRTKNREKLAAKRKTKKIDRNALPYLVSMKRHFENKILFTIQEEMAAEDREKSIVLEQKP